MNKKSAVDYLLNELVYLATNTNQLKLLIKVYEKAKEIEKQQILDAFITSDVESGLINNEEYAHIYYNEFYGKKENQ